MRQLLLRTRMQRSLLCVDRRGCCCLVRLVELSRQQRRETQGLGPRAKWFIFKTANRQKEEYDQYAAAMRDSGDIYSYFRYNILHRVLAHSIECGARLETCRCSLCQVLNSIAPYQRSPIGVFEVNYKAWRHCDLHALVRIILYRRAGGGGGGARHLNDLVIKALLHNLLIPITLKPGAFLAPDSNPHRFDSPTDLKCRRIWNMI